jgi:hypothetical protein
MPTIKVLGQSYPTAATATTLYTCGVANGTVVSTLNACNTSTTADTIRIAVRPAGATLANQHYLAYNVTVPANGQYSFQGGISLANTDVITIYSTNGTCAFGAYGQEQ